MDVKFVIMGRPANSAKRATRKLHHISVLNVLQIVTFVTNLPVVPLVMRDNIINIEHNDKESLCYFKRLI